MTIDTAYFKKKLVEERALLEKELSGIASPGASGNPEDWDARSGGESVEKADLNVAADAYEELEERHAVSDVLEKRLENVRGALERIDGGTYGICAVCGGTIEEKRLEANAAARTCIEHRSEEGT